MEITWISFACVRTCCLFAGLCVYWHMLSQHDLLLDLSGLCPPTVRAHREHADTKAGAPEHHTKDVLVLNTRPRDATGRIGHGLFTGQKTRIKQTILKTTYT